jgi:dipeptidyl aminopeptidase/acylaminoacyl peptidase
MSDAPARAPHLDGMVTRALLAVRAPLHASMSPDGRHLALTTVRVPSGTQEEIVELELVDVRSGQRTPLAGLRPGDRFAEWSPDGRYLAVVADDADDTVLAVLEVATRSRRLLTNTAGVAGPAAWSPDGTRLAVPRRRGTVIDRTRPFRWTRPFPAADGVGPLEDPPQLCLVELGTGTSTWLTDDGWRWSSPQWAPAGDRIAAVASLDPTDRVGGQALRLLDPSGVFDEGVVLGGRAVVARFLDDGALAALVAEPNGRPGGSETELHVFHRSASRRIAVPDLMGDVFGDCAAELGDTYDNLLIPRGRTVIVRTGARGRLGIAVVDVDSEEVRPVLDGPRACTPVACAGGLLVFTRQSPDTYPELATIELDLVGAQEQSLLRFADAGAAAVEVERFAVTSPDGWDLDGWFLSPRGAVGPLPTVVVVHGGPHYAYGEAFSLDAQALCAAGFGVLYTNPRGSTGYGDGFAHAVHGDWAEGPSRDLLSVVDEAVARGWADPLRLGIAGNSYGGYLAAWLASTTSRFAAAVIENPVIDLLGMYGTSDIGRRFFPAQLGGPPHERIDVYVGQSPLLQAHRCRTPCLFVTGELDRRCPSGQAWAMHRVLCEVGTPSEVLVLPGSSHEGSTYGPPSARIAHDESLVGWMRNWLVGEDPDQSRTGMRPA